MLIPKPHLDGIAAGAVRLAFRRWSKPSVKRGGTQLTRIGRIRFGDVTITTLRAITETEARGAGHADRDELVDWLKTLEGKIYRIEIAGIEADPRVALRAAPPSADELAEIRRRLDRLDAASPHGPWTRTVLALIDTRPAVRAGDLATALGRERLSFKIDVRKLKNLGLTESLEIGYRLSPRGQAVLATAAAAPPCGPTRNTSRRSRPTRSTSTRPTSSSSPSRVGATRWPAPSACSGRCPAATPTASPSS